MSTHRILLVEDSKEVQIIVCAALKRKFAVTTASSLTEAMNELKAHTVSLIILDVGLPDGDGFRACAEIKMQARHSTTPIIFLTGKTK